MQEIINPLQSISYTKKDFQTIYPELLNLVKQLTNKWDPSLSNESDPGVILIKLNALIADKCNYNIDKNVLECFPLSVTQESNARQLFEQLGYNMRWYQSATTFLTMNWIGSQSKSSVSIPKFTMVTGDDNLIIYTIVGSVPVNSAEFIINDLTLPLDGTRITAKAIQGVAVKYDINGNSTITPSNLDANNRIYFPTSNVAENGIFITNIDAENYQQWVKKDNLVVENLGNTFYSFGVSSDGNSCYVEFPEDAPTILKDGINIVYIRTDGSYGNIQTRYLSKFYADTPVQIDGESVVLNNDNMFMTNYFSAINGRDYEDIDSAYKNYKRTVGTFNTLITLRDYFNYIVTNNLASNVVVTDRSNDIQSTHNIVTMDNNVNLIKTHVMTDETGAPELTAFSLKFYATKYYQDVSSIAIYNNTFKSVSSSELSVIQKYVEDIKSLSHDFVSPLYTTDTRSRVCYFKNVYPIQCNVTPKYTLTSIQKLEVENNVKIALYNALNAKEIDFGDSISTDYLYAIVLNADNRINNVTFSEIQYTTYAVYYTGKDILTETVISKGDVVTLEPSTSSASFYVDPDTYLKKLESEGTAYSYSDVVFTYKNGWKLSGNLVQLVDYGIVVSGTPTSEMTLTVKIDKATRIRDEIFTKCVLAGVTQLLIESEIVDCRWDQLKSNNISIYSGQPAQSFTYNPWVNNVMKITPISLISMNQTDSQYTLKQNESLYLYAPNVVTKNSFSNYVKYECKLDSTIPQNTKHKLTANEYIVFYYKATSSSQLYSYQVYGSGCIISSNFQLSNMNISSTGQEVKQWMDSYQVNQLSSSTRSLTTLQSTVIADITDTSKILSSSKQIDYCEINQVTLDKGTYCYWVLNNHSNEQCTLFESDQTTRTLQSGEYFFYADASLTQLVTLSTGTTLVRKNSVAPLTKWTVPYVPLTNIVTNGIDAISDWYPLPADPVLTVTENQIITVDPTYVFQAQPRNSTSGQWTLNFDNVGYTATIGGKTANLSQFILKYRSPGQDEPTVLMDLSQLMDEGWNARSILNISVSGGTEQILYNNQNLLLTTSTKDSSENYITIKYTGGNLYTPQSSTISRYPMVFRCSSDIYSTTTSEIDTTLSDGTYPTFYGYSKLYKDSSNLINYLDSGALSVTFPAGTTEKEIQIMLPKNSNGAAQKYLLPVFVGQLDNNATLKLMINGQELRPLYLDSSPILKSNATHALSYLSATSDPVMLKITLSKALEDQDIGVGIRNPYAYEDPTMMNRVLTQMKEFDPEHKFDFTYTVPEDNQIDDPCSADSFLLSNHPFNKFCICKMDTSSNTKIKVVTV